MASTSIQNSLMRPAVLQIFRAAGFHNTSSAVLDVATDLTLRYLMLLAAKTAHYAANNHEPNLKNYQRDETSSGSSTGSNSDRADSHDYDYDYDYTGEAITIQDVRMAMMDLGALRPQMSILEERARKPVSIDGVWGDESSEQLRKVPYEDMRGTNAFLKWAKGPINQEIRRIAGLATVASNIGGTAAAAGRGVIGAAPSSGAADAMEVGIALDKNEDYLTVLKKKHGNRPTGGGDDEESRFRGTLLASTGISSSSRSGEAGTMTANPNLDHDPHQDRHGSAYPDFEPVTIVGGGEALSSIRDWASRLAESRSAAAAAAATAPTATADEAGPSDLALESHEIAPIAEPSSSIVSSAPLTPLDEAMVEG